MSVPPDLSELEREELGPPPASTNGAEDGWRLDRNGKQYIPRPGRRGNIYRQGEETPEQARERDARPRDERPRKPKKPKKPEAPRKVDLRELEAALAEGFKAPGMACAMMGDEWAAQHFTMHGPVLARNLVRASEHNPWLRAKLEEAATGEEAMMKVISLAGVGVSCAVYIVPPVIYWLNLPVPERTRAMFGIPARRVKEPAYAAAAAPSPTDAAGASEAAEAPEA